MIIGVSGFPVTYKKNNFWIKFWFNDTSRVLETNKKCSNYKPLSIYKRRCLKYKNPTD